MPSIKSEPMPQARYEDPELNAETTMNQERFDKWQGLGEVKFAGDMHMEKHGTSHVEDFKGIEFQENGHFAHPAADVLAECEKRLKNLDENDPATPKIRENLQNAMREAIIQNPLTVTMQQWKGMDDRQRRRYYGLKLKEAKTLGYDDNLTTYWQENFDRYDAKRDEYLAQKASQERSANPEEKAEVVPLAEVLKELSDPRYEELGHGTTSAENAESIMEKGLQVGGFGRDSSISGNFLALSNDNPDNLSDTINKWQHKNAKQIILFRVPVKYKLPAGLFLDQSDPTGSSMNYPVFYTPNKDDGDGYGVEGTYNSDFVFGWYDADSGQVHKNPNYRGDLDNPDDVAKMEESYRQAKQAALKKITDNDQREEFLGYANAWHNYDPSSGA